MSPSRIDGRFFGGPTPLPAAGPARFSLAGESKVEVKEASDVVALPKGGFLVVGDLSDSAGYISADGKQSRVKLDGIKNHQSGLEGAAYDPLKNKLFVASEEKREIYRYSFDAKTGSAKLEKSFKVALDGADNKGVEGLAYLRGDFSPSGRPKLIAVKEGEPKTIALFDEDGSGKPEKVKLDDALKDAAKDFSAVAVDPISGHLFITSDESALVAEVKLKKKGDEWKAELVQSLPLRDDKGDALKRVEGVTFDERGNLFVLQENSRKLWKFDRK